jgi:hypothetical protein
MPDPVDVGAQSDLFGATAPAVARPPITEQNGGSVRVTLDLPTSLSVTLSNDTTLRPSCD